ILVLYSFSQAVMASITAARRSNAPACAPCHIMANSPDTLYTAKGDGGVSREAECELPAAINTSQSSQGGFKDVATRVSSVVPCHLCPGIIGDTPRPPSAILEHVDT
ncbi:hypothetical protein INR49_023404, partial [Caranx melampygus]